MARLSRNWLVARLAAGYVGLFRNIPLLLQLFFWYTPIP
jgi:general L-amino acid transport system permease protein